MSETVTREDQLLEWLRAHEKRSQLKGADGWASRGFMVAMAASDAIPGHKTAEDIKASLHKLAEEGRVQYYQDRSTMTHWRPQG